jgi:branched-chain amino acid transport system substrate-binding protein
MRRGWWGAGAAAVALAAAASAWSASAGPKLTVYSSLPEQGASAPQARAIEEGARMALSDHGGKVGKYRIVYRRLDDSLRSTGAADEGRGARDARKAAHDKSTIGYLGQYNSAISKVTIPILNKAGIAQISPSNTYNGLTTAAPGHAPGEPAKYYPTGRRTYARVLPNDVVQGGALARAARQDGCASAHVFNSGTVYSSGLAQNAVAAAGRIGLKIERSESYDPRATSYKSLAKRVKAPCVIQTGEIEESGTRVLKAVAAAHDHVRMYGGDGICLNASSNPDRGIPPSIAPRFHCTIAALGPKGFGPKGRQFFTRFSARYNRKYPDVYAIYGYESMSLMLDAMRRGLGPAGGLTTGRVVAALFATRNRASVIGTYGIDRNGDTTLTDYGLYRISGKWLTFDRVVRG